MAQLFQNGAETLSTDPGLEAAPPAPGAAQRDDAAPAAGAEAAASPDVRWQALAVRKDTRAQRKGQVPGCIWFTGLPSSGKTTLANLLEQRLHAEGKHTYLLDGDNMRHGLCSDLGFTDAARAENIRRIGEVARLMVDAGLIVLVSVISPFERERGVVRALFADHEFLEVFIDTPIEECERRDVKGLYAKARIGTVRNVTGIDSPYERPAHPDLVVKTIGVSPDACVSEILARFHARGPGADFH